MARVHRTTTTATLLAAVAVSALSGCVTVQRPPVPGPPAAQPSAPRPDGRAGPGRAVQAPAREALELIGPSPRPRTDVPAPRRAAAPPAVERQPAPLRHSRPRTPAVPPRQPRRPRVAIPDVSESVRATVRRHTDVCALGRQYGGWQPDSPEAVICGHAYQH
ncbi:hypothetical protein ABZT03_13515 [Streptomyces sp. NPDC005574]|uniref:hypothetical protein n=1 Tax=Streptomyces sp. NPDC005574 TaxID=3156891 RepID=UPI0033B56312